MNPESTETKNAVKPAQAATEKKSPLHEAAPKKPDTSENNDPGKEFQAGEKEGDFPPDIEMNKSSISKNFDTDQATANREGLDKSQNQPINERYI